MKLHACGFLESKINAPSIVMLDRDRFVIANFHFRKIGYCSEVQVRRLLHCEYQEVRSSANFRTFSELSPRQKSEIHQIVKLIYERHKIYELVRPYFECHIGQPPKRIPSDLKKKFLKSKMDLQDAATWSFMSPTD